MDAAGPADRPAGLRFRLPDGAAAQAAAQQALQRLLAGLGLDALVQAQVQGDVQEPGRGQNGHGGDPGVCTLSLAPEAFLRLCGGFDTLDLQQRLPGTDPAARSTPERLLQETWVALLAAPQRIDFSSLDELQSHVRIRVHIAQAAARTALAFRTNAAERPAEHWVYDEDLGFLLRPQADLVAALVAATQPEATGRLYDFSCYRATEYVILLGIALEAREHRPALYAQLQALNRRLCIKSGRFHDTYLIEFGTVDAPLPMRWYVPGDRVWFKNPDEPSAHAEGYEGSWVIYLGGGLFSNFWQRDRPYTLAAKLLEIFHWRHATQRDAEGHLRMDEDRVEALVRETAARPAERQAVIERLTRYRDPAGVYAQGGCIDASREFPLPLSRIVLPGC